MKTYLVWKRQSYCDYNVIFVTFNKHLAEELVKNKNANSGYERFRFEERLLDQETEGSW